MRCLLLALACLGVAAPVAAAEPNLPNDVTLPLFRAQVPAGGGTTVALPNAHGPRWSGALPQFAGVTMYSRGELVYRDHIFDAYGADNGQDAQRLSVLDPATAAVPEFYRLDPAYQYAPGEFGVPTGPLTTETHYGDQGMQAEADLSEVRVATDDERDLIVRARTTTMKDTPGTALLILLDTKPGSTSYSVPFNSGLKTSVGDVAILVTPSGVQAVDLASGKPIDLGDTQAAYDPSGYTNSVTVTLPASLLGDATHKVGVVVASGIADGNKLKTLGGPGHSIADDLADNGVPGAPDPDRSSSNPSGVNVANVAFRNSEPARNWWDKQQALALYAGNIDQFFYTADLDRMAAGANEAYVPGPGYHDRIFTSTEDISAESDVNGILQHYGVYLPSGYRADASSPAMYWFHFRGGDAHIAAAVVPGLFEDMGEDHHAIVVTPDGRGESGWYVGKSQMDVLQVWKDSHDLLNIDRDRTYIAGHSMGGWASWLLPIEHPDWFAGAFPASGPSTQGAWTGAGQPGDPQCDPSYTYSDYNPCFVEANDGNARAEWIYPLIDNLRWVPQANYQGAEDELVPVTGVTLSEKKLQDLGYRYHYFLFHGQEHYGPPVMDQWKQGANYIFGFRRDPNPPEVTYIRSMVFEHALNTVNTNTPSGGKVDPGIVLDRAYWMSGLQAADAAKGVAKFDGTSLGITNPPHTTQPWADAGPKSDNGTPYTAIGQDWRTDLSAAPATKNAFTATLTGAKAVTLCLHRMNLSAGKELDGDVNTDNDLALSLTDVFGPVDVTIDGKPATTDSHDGTLTIDVPKGDHKLVITPRG
jgi:pimeloyl-ACP methyl ester carboxylesterase